jgi:hypothetical protein
LFDSLLKILRALFHSRPAFESLSLNVSQSEQQPPPGLRPLPAITRSLIPPSTLAAKHRDCSSKLERLGRTAWKTQESLKHPHFSLDSSRLPQTCDAAALDLTLRLLLTHGRIVAPGLSVPFKVPLIAWSGRMSEGTAGGFAVEGDGWVRIEIHSRWRGNARVVRAILAHEVCHYILANSGLQLEETWENERLTDVCMFVCGFGSLFFAGYKSVPDTIEYQSGHRLGYLTDSELEFVSNYVWILREVLVNQLPSKADELRGRLRHMTHNQASADRLVTPLLVSY